MSSFSLLCLLSLCCLSFTLSFAAAQTETFDYVVIGAGTAGCAVAGRLAEADAEASVLLLERGHFPSEEQWDSVDQNSHLLSFNLWESSNYSRKWPSEPNPGLGNASVEMFYADSVGGATMINTGQYSRPHASYFNAWNLPNWEWDKVSPFYLQMENHKPSSNSSSASFFGTGGPLPISMSFEQTHGKDFIAAIKYNNETFLDGQEALEEESEAFLQAPRIILNGKRVTSYQAYVEPLLQDAEANIELRTRVAVDKIILKEKQTEASEESDESKWIAVGVVYRDEEGREREVRVRREVIVSAGVYDSPIVLMRSGIGPEEHLSSIGIDTLIDLPAVGQNLKNRGGYTVTSVLAEPTLEMTIDPENETVIAQWESDPDSSPLSASLAEILGFGKSSSESPDIDMMYEMTNVIPRSIGVHVDTLVCILAKVRSTGHVELRSEDPWDNAKVWPNFLGDEGDWEALLSCIDFMRTLNTAPSMTAIHTLEFLPGTAADTEEEIRKAIKGRFTNTVHAWGTCQIGDAEEESTVVDQYLMVRGTENVRVADTSILPATHYPLSGLMATAYMVGERAAAMVSEAGYEVDEMYYEDSSASSHSSILHLLF